MSTTPEILQLITDLLGGGSDTVTKAEHKPLLDAIANSLLNKETDANLLGLLEHDPSRPYVKGEGIFKDGQLWAANQAIAIEAFNPTKWDQITGTVALSDYQIDEWEDDFPGGLGTGYSLDQQAVRDDRLWRSDSDSNTADPLVSGWTEISANDGLFGNVWTEGRYKQDQVITNLSDHKLYYLATATPTAPFFNSVDLDAEIVAGDWVLFHSFALQSLLDVLGIDNVTGGIDIIFGSDLAIFGGGQAIGDSSGAILIDNQGLIGGIILRTLLGVISLDAPISIAGSNLLSYANIPTLTDPKNVPHKGYVDGFVRTNHVLVDDVSKLPTPSGGKHVLDDNISYEFNGTIISPDFIEIGLSNIMYGVDKSNDIFVYTGTGAAIRGIDNDFSLLRMSVVAGATGAEAFTFSGDNTNNVEITNCIFGNCDKIGTVTGGIDNFVFQHNFNTGCEDGITFTGTNKGHSISKNLFVESPSGAATWIDIPSGTVIQADYTSNSFGVGSGDTAINIVEASVTRTIVVIQKNFVIGAGAGLTGVNAKDQGIFIPPKSNQGISGLFTADLTIVLSSFVTTVTTFGTIPETLPLSDASDKEEGATTFMGNLEVSVTHDASGEQMEYRLLNLTDGTPVTGSTKLVTITTGGVFQLEKLAADVVLAENKEYRVQFRKVTGTGGASVFLRSGVIELKAF